MSNLAEIPQCTALHLPTPTSSPLPLATGTLTLSVLPANPPAHPAETLTLAIGSAAFPLLPNSPIQKIQSKDEHPSYIFSPVASDGGEPIGQVKITLSDSKSQEEWDAAQAACASFEAALKARHVWDEKVLFVNDEWEATPSTTKGWGEMIAGGVMGASQAIATRLGSFTDKHISTTDPSHPAPPSDRVASAASAANSRTSALAENATAAATKVGGVIHEGGKRLGAQLPESMRPSGQPIPEAEKGELRKFAEDGWTQLTFAAKGIASAAGTVAGSVSQSAHRAVEHNFGKPAEAVAQDVGQTGANLGSTAWSAGTATSVIVQGANAGQGMAASGKPPGTGTAEEKV